MLTTRRGMFDTQAREIGTWKGRLVLAGGGRLVLACEIDVSRGEWC